MLMFMTIQKVVIYTQNVVLKRKRTFAVNGKSWQRFNVAKLKLCVVAVKKK